MSIIGRRPRSSKFDRLPPARPQSSASDRHLKCIPTHQQTLLRDSPAAAALGSFSIIFSNRGCERVTLLQAPSWLSPELALTRGWTTTSGRAQWRGKKCVPRTGKHPLILQQPHPPPLLFLAHILFCRNTNWGFLVEKVGCWVGNLPGQRSSLIVPDLIRFLERRLDKNLGNILEDLASRSCEISYKIL